MIEYKWNIFLANLDPVVGSEQGKTRPVLVISEEEINQILPVLNWEDVARCAVFV